MYLLSHDPSLDVYLSCIIRTYHDIFPSQLYNENYETSMLQKDTLKNMVLTMKRLCSFDSNDICSMSFSLAVVSNPNE